MNTPMSLALLTDLYQLTMAYGYWKLGHAEREAAFHLSFRKPPFAGGYAVVAGLGPAIEYLQGFRFDESDIAYLAKLTGNDDERLFEDGFLEYLKQIRLAVDIDAMPEGTVAFAQEPLVRVRGAMLQCQILETALLNIVNFQTLIATKAARICSATGGEPVLEFGLRRAQGVDGGLTASRAAYLGGCAATSNVLAGKKYGIPVKGTHAHSWVMSFDDELSAFDGYAEAMPNNSVFLVDTYDTLEGVRNAVQVGHRLRDRGYEMVGIRLDSGDLSYLSIEARKILDAGGFPNATIVASNDLDEHIIESLKSQGAKIAVWGVGTRLVTAYDQPALGGVYKLGAMKDDRGEWQPKVKLSEQAAKTTIPGVLQVRRFYANDKLAGDMIYDATSGIDAREVIVDMNDSNRRKRMPSEALG
ncbi:MAG: nicotinate phosphoribosyltransferase, partial [Pirellulales bacterium]